MYVQLTKQSTLKDKCLLDDLLSLIIFLSAIKRL